MGTTALGPFRQPQHIIDPTLGLVPPESNPISYFGSIPISLVVMLLSVAASTALNGWFIAPIGFVFTKWPSKEIYNNYFNI